MLRKTEKYIVMFITFFCISIFTLITVVNVMNLSSSLNERNQKYSENSASFNINTKGEEILLNDLLECFALNEEDYLSIGLYYTFKDEIHVTAVYNGEDSNIVFPIIKGRTFNAEDFTNGDKVAVVKDSIYKQLNIEDGEFLEYAGEKYKIIGVIDDKKGEYLNDIYINISSILNNNMISQNAVLYSYLYDNKINGKSKLSNLYNKLSDKFPGTTILSEDLIKGEDALFFSFKMLKIFIIGLALLIIVQIITIINITTYWIDNEKIEFGIRKLVGATNKQLSMLLIKKYLLITLIANICGFITYEIIKLFGLFRVLNIQSISFKIDIISFLILLIITFAISVIVLIKPIIRIGKVEINSVIRGGVI